MSSIENLLPPSLLLGPHLSAYRYFFVCTLTIASWDTLGKRHPLLGIDIALLI